MQAFGTCSAVRLRVFDVGKPRFTSSRRRIVEVGPATPASTMSSMSNRTSASLIELDIGASSPSTQLRLSSGDQTVTGVRHGSPESPVAIFWTMRYALAERWQFGRDTEQTCGKAKTDDVPKQCFHQREPAKVWRLLTGTTRVLGNPRERCVQFLLVMGRMGHEDCLFLDVYTAAVKKTGGIDTSADLPVIMWFHGGAYLMGDKYQNGIHDARQFAQERKAVVVTVNYRLGVMGFLSHPSLKQNNFGLHDQFLAMQWMNKHAKAFGGNPAALTIVGQSAGAMSICAHLASPQSRPLFHAAVLQSGNCDGGFLWSPASTAKRQGQIFLRALFGRIRGCHSQSRFLTYDPPVVNSDYGGKGTWSKWYYAQTKCKDIPKLAQLVTLCGDIFRIPEGESKKNDYIRIRLPFAGIGPCDNEYNDCEKPSRDKQAFRHVDDDGDSFDRRLFQCASLLNPSHIWVNRFGLSEAPRTEAPWGMMKIAKSIFGVDITGLPAQLPWRPAFGFEPGHGSPLLQADAGDKPHTGLVRHPLTYLKEGPPLEKNVIIGWTSEEGSIFAPVLGAFVPEVNTSGKKTLDLDDLEEGGMDIGVKVICVHAPEQCPDLINQLRTRKRYTEEDMVVTKMITDYLFACPQLRSARALANQPPAPPKGLVELVGAAAGQSAPQGATRAWVFRYEIDNVLKKTGLRRHTGAFHMSDVFAVFNCGNLPLVMRPGITWNAEDQEISRAFQESLIQLGPCTTSLKENWHPLTQTDRDRKSVV